MRKTESPSLVGRVVLALALTLGFYVMALGIAAGLLWIPYELFKTTEHVNGQITIFCVVTACLILYSVFPRRDVFEAPGPELSESEYPALFALLRRVAQATSQAMPVHVYLVPDLNAWVANRGGIVGIGSRRVMGLGLPTFQALTIPQFAAVIAHEFGHYHHGDVALGPLLYRLRAGLGRTLHALEERRNFVAIPFRWYGNLFLRVTGGVSRKQEFGADALAAQVTGPEALASGLKTVHVAGAQFDGYWATEVVPVLASGFKPPIAEGFARFVESPRVAEANSAVLQSFLDAPPDPYDTHPPLAQRLNALTDIKVTPMLELAEGSKAIGLLSDVDRAETALIRHLAGGAEQAPTTRLEWADVGREVWIPVWRKRVEEHAEKLKRVRCTDAGALATDRDYLAVRMGFAANSGAANEEDQYNASVLFGSALMLALLDRGGSLSCEVGEDPAVTFGGATIKPFAACDEIASGALASGEWVRQCEQAGINNQLLSDALAKTPVIAQ